MEIIKISVEIFYTDAKYPTVFNYLITPFLEMYFSSEVSKSVHAFMLTHILC